MTDRDLSQTFVSLWEVAEVYGCEELQHAASATVVVAVEKESELS